MIITAAKAQQQLVTVDMQPLVLKKEKTEHNTSRVGKVVLEQMSDTPIFTSFPSATILHAQGLADTHRAVGYTDDDSISIDNAYIGTVGTFPVAAMLSGRQLSSYAGSKIVGVRFAVGQTIGKSSVFIRSVGAGGEIADTLVSQSIRRTGKGWNNVFFNSGKEILLDGTESLLFGFDYNETESMVEAQTGGLAFYTPPTVNQSASLIYGNFGLGNGWYSLADMGNLCVQLIVDVSNKAVKDIDMTDLLIGRKYKKAGESIDYLIMYSNVGREAISNFQMGCRIDQREPVFIDINTALAEAGSDGHNDQIELPADLAVGQHLFTCFVNTIDGQPITTFQNDTISQKFYIYENELPRQQHYVEQYNNQNDYMPSIVNPLMNQVTDDNICLVNVHHAGTSLAVSDASYLETLYAYTYPCFTVNRLYFFGEAHIAFDANDYVLIFPDIIPISIRSLVNEADLNPALAAVDIQSTYNTAMNQLSVTVSGSVSTDVPSIFENIALTVMLAEDTVTAPQMVYNANTGATSTENDYVHHHVLRKFLSAPVGDRIDINDDRYTMTYTTTLDAAWVPEHMKVVAFVTKATDTVTSDNVLDMDIINCNSFKLYETVISGISEISNGGSDDTGCPREYFTLDGKHVNKNQLTRGVYILKQGSRRTKVLVR